MQLCKPPRDSHWYREFERVQYVGAWEYLKLPKTMTTSSLFQLQIMQRNVYPEHCDV